MEPKETLLGIKNEITAGFIYTHLRLNDNTKKTLESSSFLYALIELLDKKGIISIKDLETQKKAVAERLVEKFTRSGLGLMYQNQDIDKYDFDQEAEIDCQAHLSTCKAACCKMPFALSKQDIDEGVIKWEFGRPYMIAHGKDGYCIHLDRETYQCTVHDKRPIPCRGFDCRNNENWPVWSNFEKKEMNVKLTEKIKRSNEAYYTIPD